MITAKALKPTSQSQSQPTREDYVELNNRKGGSCLSLSCCS